MANIITQNHLKQVQGIMAYNEVKAFEICLKMLLCFYV